MALENEKQIFDFHSFKNEIPNGSETDVHPEIINEKKKKKEKSNHYTTASRLMFAAVDCSWASFDHVRVHLLFLIL